MVAPSPEDWHTWNRFTWSKALLDHYFGRPELGPASSLNVTDQELALVTGDNNASPEEVRQQLIERVLAPSIKSDKDYFDVATKSTTLVDVPFFAHLIVSCIAAVELGATKESSYIEHFINLVKDTTHDSRLGRLAELWEILEQWLADRVEYRDLELPEVGSWTRIGYSVRLAFPSRLDQRQLQRCLERDQLVGADPSTGSVIQSVSRGKASFSAHFWSKFEDFRSLHRDGAPQHVLLTTPFWSAVELAAGIRLERGKMSAQWTLLAEDDGFDLDLIVATNSTPGSADLEATANPSDGERWTFVVSSTALPDLGRQVLTGEKTITTVSAIVSGGVLPFILNATGQLELARRSELAEVEVVLARDDVVGDLKSLFSAGPPRDRLSRHSPGWSVVRNLALRALPSSDLVASKLADCQILQEAPSTAEVRLVGGVRVEDGFLGLADHLPTVVADQADSVMLAQPDDIQLDLRRSGSRWELPRRDLEGEYQLVASFGDGRVSTKVTFLGRPAVERPKQPQEPDGYLAEYLACAIPLTQIPLVKIRLEQDLVKKDADFYEYLGSDVGEFLPTLEGAAWIISKVGRTGYIRRRDPTINIDPRARVDDPGQRRRWRRTLSEAEAHPSDPEARSLARSIARSIPDHLPLRDGGGFRPPKPQGDVLSDKRVARVLEILVAITNRRIGLEPRQWSDILRQELGLNPGLLAQVQRAWTEAGFTREVVNVRSGKSLVAGVEPAFWVCETDDWFAGTLMGTVLPSTRSRVREAARSVGILTVERTGASSFVPPLLSVRSRSWEALASLAENLGLGVLGIPDSPEVVRPRDLTSNRPLNYEDEGEARLSSPAGVIIESYWKRWSPQVWEVRTPDQAIWTHFPNSAVFWAQAMTGAQVLRLTDDQLIASPTAAPLGVVHWLTSLSGIPPGYGEDSDEYLVGSPNIGIALEALKFIDGYVGRTLSALDAG